MIKPIHLRWPAKCHRVTDELLSTYIFIGKKNPKMNPLWKNCYIYIKNVFTFLPFLIKNITLSN